MPKEIERGQEIYVAPGMLGKYEGGRPIIIDERNNNKILNPRDIDTKICIYEREVNEWFLQPAQDLLEINPFLNSFVVLMVCMSYLEGVEQYKTGVDSTGRSSEFFIKSINRLYPNKYQKRYLTKLYSKSRCGLFHSGMVKGGVVFNNDFNEALSFENNGERIRINPTVLLSDISIDFDEYISDLSKSDIDSCKILRENFDRLFNVTRS